MGKDKLQKPLLSTTVETDSLFSSRVISLPGSLFPVNTGLRCAVIKFPLVPVSVSVLSSIVDTGAVVSIKIFPEISFVCPFIGCSAVTRYWQFPSASSLTWISQFPVTLSANVEKLSFPIVSLTLAPTVAFPVNLGALILVI